MTKTELIQRASINASLAAIMERLEKFDARLRNVEDGLLLILNSKEHKPKPKATKKETKEK